MIWPWSKPCAPPTSLLRVHLPGGRVQLLRFRNDFPEVWIEPEYDDVLGAQIVGVRITPAPQFRGQPEPTESEARDV